MARTDIKKYTHTHTYTHEHGTHTCTHTHTRRLGSKDHMSLEMGGVKMFSITLDPLQSTLDDIIL